MKIFSRLLCRLGMHRLGIPADTAKRGLTYRCVDCAYVYSVPYTWKDES